VIAVAWNTFLYSTNAVTPDKRYRRYEMKLHFSGNRAHHELAAKLAKTVKPQMRNQTRWYRKCLAHERV
jgi:hypothetical protein